MSVLKATTVTVALCVFLAALPLLAQEKPHAAHHPPPATDSMAMADSAPGVMPERPFGIPMMRMGSGTAWLPDASAMRAWHFVAGRWMLMVIIRNS